MINLLVVDDEVLTRTVLQKIIEDNYSAEQLRVIGEAKNGMEALALVKLHKPDIVLMDVKLPGLSGLAVTREIKKSFPQMKVVMISAYDEFEFAQTALQLGAYDYILKPCLAENLLPVVEKAINDIEKEKNRQLNEDELKERLRETMPYIRISLGYDLLSGTGYREEELRARLEFVGEKGLPGLVMVAYIDQFMEEISCHTEAQRQNLKNDVYNAINAAISDTCSFCLPLGRDELVIFIMQENESPEKIKKKATKVAEMIRSAVEDSTSMTVTVGVGNHYGVERLHLSYEEAVQAYQLGGFFLGSNCVIEIGQIEELKHNQNGFPLELEPVLIDCIKNGDKDEARIVSREIIRVLLVRSNLNSAKFYLNGLLAIISRTVVGLDIGYKDLSEQTLKCLARLVRIESGKELYDWLDEVVVSHINHHYSSHTLAGSNAVQDVLDYLEENYNREITLSAISKLFYVNPVYFCRLFKSKMGVTFIEHVTMLRLEKARELLAYSDLDIREIAERVGFSNANYFSRVFKKYKNMTPSAYRAKKLI